MPDERDRSMTLPFERYWAIEASHLDEVVHQLARTDVSALKAQARPAQQRGQAFQRDGDVAVINIQGPLSKHRTLWQLIFGGKSMVELAEDVQAAADDEHVRSILLHIESPGGTVAGTQQLADTVFNARKRKPVSAFISDLGASAAYHIASQADRVYANETAVIGSIGVFSVVYDLSKLAKGQGIEVLVFRSGELKGAGVPGSEVTEAQRERFQKLVGDMAEKFIAAVTRGRRMNEQRVRELADGGVMLADEAARAGLINRVRSFDQVLGELQGGGDAGGSRAETPAPAEAPAQPQPAPAQAADVPPVPRIDPNNPPTGPEAITAYYNMIRAKMHHLGMPADQATAAVRAQLPRLWEACCRAADTSAQTPARQTAAAGSPSPRRQERSMSGQNQENAVDRWNAAINAEMQAGKSRGHAVRVVAKRDPELHRAYIKASNEQAGRAAAVRHL